MVLGDFREGFLEEVTLELKPKVWVGAAWTKRKVRNVPSRKHIFNIPESGLSMKHPFAVWPIFGLRVRETEADPCEEISWTLSCGGWEPPHDWKQESHIVRWLHWLLGASPWPSIRVNFLSPLEDPSIVLYFPQLKVQLLSDPDLLLCSFLLSLTQLQQNQSPSKSKARVWHSLACPWVFAHSGPQSALQSWNTLPAPFFTVMVTTTDHSGLNLKATSL